jgi:hypothetical protein
MDSRAGEVGGEVIDDVARIILRAMDERRLAAAEDGQPDGIEPWRIDDSAVVPQVALAIDDGNVEPAVVGAKPGGPDDGTNLATPEVETES